jgi:hypothetical protein
MFAITTSIFKPEKETITSIGGETTLLPTVNTAAFESEVCVVDTVETVAISIVAKPIINITAKIATNRSLNRVIFVPSVHL